MNLELFGRSYNPEQQRFGALVASVLLFLFNVYLNTFPPFMSYLDLRDRIQLNEQELVAATSLTTTKEDLARRETLIEAAFDRMRRGIPVRTQVLSILLVDLASLTAESNIEIVRFAPRDFQKKPKEPSDTSLPAEFSDLGLQTIELEVSGKFPNLVQLLDRLATYEGVLQVGPPTIHGAKAEPTGEGSAGLSQPSLTMDRNLNITFQVTTYALDH
ncbi:MAG: hypothetical protein VKO21_03920 [Candidatus Sericytochromatia bacterium]|nr:hypothetical protein [Candidatus Sericytochromatia bacterium]